MGAVTSTVNPGTAATATTAGTSNEKNAADNSNDGKPHIELGTLGGVGSGDQGVPSSAATATTTTAQDTNTPSKVAEHRDSKDSLMFYRNFGRDTCCVGTPPCSTHPCCGRSWWRVYVVGLPLINARQLCSSYFVSDRVLLAGRVVLTLYGTAVLIGSMCINMNEGYWFFYFTNLSYLGLIVYMWSITTFSYLYQRDPNHAQLHRQPARWQDIVCTVGYNTLFGIHILVPVVYWWLLSSTWKWNQKDDLARWLNISVHGLDFGILIFEFFLNRVIFPWGNVLFCYLIVGIYIFWTWLGAAIFPTGGPAGTGFPYFFVNYNDKSSGTWIALLAVFFLIMWTAAFLLHWAKTTVGKRLMASRGRASS